MDERMNGLMDGWMDGWMDGQNARIDARKYGWANRWISG